MLPEYKPWPRVPDHDFPATVSGDKKVMIDAFKALAGRHQFARTVMQVENDKFSIKGGDKGVIKLNVEASGRATCPVNATYMAKVLSTVEGKTATVQFDTAPTFVRVTGENAWPIRVSPMK
jgi:hypothetical protein